ncbi:hypothetical protein IWX49DRAFT_68785 [Phyllosticta citricarpa]|uniref:Uncharacterized protein n=1 Tax=Phyllosticta citricarpa TaxID=55181 RepID=A0ABR1LR51_9PEZI
MAAERDAREQAYLMICKGGKMWPAVRCRPPMEVPTEVQLQQQSQFHICVFVPIIQEFHWRMETDLTTFDNDEMNKFTKDNDPERFEAFAAVLERMVDETEPDYGWWASEILSHKLHKDFFENEPVHYKSSDSELELISAARVVQPPKPRASGSGGTKAGRKNTQSRIKGNAKVVKQPSWLNQIHQEATQNLEKKEKRKKRKSMYILDEIDDEAEPPRKKIAKSAQAKVSKEADDLKPSDLSSSSRKVTQDDNVFDMDDDDDDDFFDIDDDESIDELEFAIKQKKEEAQEGTKTQG